MRKKENNEIEWKWQERFVQEENERRKSVANRGEKRRKRKRRLIVEQKLREREWNAYNVHPQCLILGSNVCCYLAHRQHWSMAIAGMTWSWEQNCLSATSGPKSRKVRFHQLWEAAAVLAVTYNWLGSGRNGYAMGQCSQAGAVEPKVDQARLDHAWLDAPVLLIRWKPAPARVDHLQLLWLAEEARLLLFFQRSKRLLADP